ncbi:MAG: monovalent cation:proton antiporter-2 (CPA2) family protein [Agarilytica sp.]
MELHLESVHVPYLLETVAFLLAVVVIVPLFKKIKVSPILGYLAIGALIGPHAIGVIHDITEVQHFAELGVIFLLFTIGLELSFERLKAYSGLIFGLGASQVITCACAIGLAAYFWGNDIQASIIIGLCLSLSSTAMVVQLLSERGELSSQHGRSSFSVLLFQDLAVVPILILLATFGKGEEGDGVIAAISIAFTKAVIAIGLIVLIGRFGLRKFFEIAAHTRSIDVFTAMTLLTILAISMATGVAGLSMALGAFLAGLLLAETEFRHQIEGEIEPFKGLFLGLFFMGVGMNLDFVVAFERGIWVLASVVGLIATKAIITFICARLFRVRTDHAIRSALLLSEGGEFAFVVIGQATLTYNIVSVDVGQFMVVVAGLSMMLTPVLAFVGQKASERFANDTSLTTDCINDQEIHDHVVIAGFGRVGKAVATILQNEQIPYIGIDNNTEEISELRKTNSSLFVGDASRAEVLRQTGVERAAALLITMNSSKAAIRTLHVARQHWPDLTIIVRAHDTSHSEELMAMGASQVVPETLEASLQLSNCVLRSTGLSREEANTIVDNIRNLAPVRNYDSVSS